MLGIHNENIEEKGVKVRVPKSISAQNLEDYFNNMLKPRTTVKN